MELSTIKQNVIVRSHAKGGTTWLSRTNVRLFLSLFFFGLFFHLSANSAYAWPPVVNGSVRINGTNAPLVNVEVIWHNKDGATRTTNTDGAGNFTFPPQDFFGCNENPHKWTVNLATVPFSTVCGSTTAELNNVTQNTNVGTIPCNPPPPPPPSPPPTSTPKPTFTPTPSPTKVPCGGPCTSNDQCDLECPICTPEGCVAPTPTPLPCNGPCSNDDQCNLECPICTPNGCKPKPTPFWTCGTSGKGCPSPTIKK